MARVTLEAFGRTVECHYSMASRIRSGDRLPGPELLGRIVSAYDLNASEALAAYSTGPVAFSQYLKDHVFSVPERSEPSP